MNEQTAGKCSFVGEKAAGESLRTEVTWEVQLDVF